MTLIHRHIKTLMLVSGLLTTTMIYAVFSPAGALEASFGEPLEGQAAELVVRNWGALITVVGLMLIHGAFDAASRTVALLAACASKTVFIGLVLSNGTRYVGHGAGTAVAVDAVMVILFVTFLVSSRRQQGVAAGV